jgi:anti-sigma-K factor RskA
VKLLGGDLHTLTGAYALDAIDGPERGRFEHHLARCQSCDKEVRSLQETATRLGLAAAAVPPEELRTRVLTAVPRTRQVAPPADSHLRPLPSAPGRRTRRVAVPVAVVALVAVVVLGVLLGISRHQVSTTTAQQRAIAAVLSAPDAKLIKEPTAVGGAATVVFAANLHKFVFTSSGLPALASTQVYELWVIGPAGTAASAGLLAAAVDGRTAPVLSGGLAPGDRVGVTVEPAGGTSKPTTNPIVLISPS